MSELKVIKIELNNHGKPIASIQGTTSYYGISPNDTFYPKSEADKVIEDKDKEIAELKAMAKESSVPSRSCRKCGSVGTLMYMPIVKDEHTYWGLYNKKGMDYVFGIQCAHCGEVAFVTKQTLEYELRKQKFKRCLAMAMVCRLRARWFGFHKKEQWALQWHRRWLKIADKYKKGNV